MNELQPKKDGLRLALLVEGGLAIIAFVLAWLLGIPLLERLASSFNSPYAARSVGRGVLATLPMFAIFWLLMRSQRPSLVQLRRQVEWLVHDLFEGATVWHLGLVSTLAGVGEELLFRGLLQPLIGSWTSPLIGLFAASLLFGLAHAVSKLYFLLASIIGFYFGWLTIQYNDLLSPIVAHGLYDFVVLVYLVRSRNRTIKTGRAGA